MKVNALQVPQDADESQETEESGRETPSFVFAAILSGVGPVPACPKGFWPSAGLHVETARSEIIRVVTIESGPGAFWPGCYSGGGFEGHHS